jgi:hypothetical protein
MLRRVTVCGLDQTVKTLMARLDKTAAHIFRQIAEAAPQVKIGRVNEAEPGHCSALACSCRLSAPAFPLAHRAQAGGGAAGRRRPGVRCRRAAMSGMLKGLLEVMRDTGWS